MKMHDFAVNTERRVFTYELKSEENFFQDPE